MAQVESVVEPDSLWNDIDIGWESVALIGIHVAMLSISGSYVGTTLFRYQRNLPRRAERLVHSMITLKTFGCYSPGSFNGCHLTASLQA